MNKSETSELLTFAAAYDQRTIGHADVEAWAIALAAIPWDDTARAAIAAFYSTPAPPAEIGGDSTRRFMQPHQFVAARSRIRKNRIERLPFPCPNTVDGVSELDEIRAITRAIGDGLITTKAELAAYERWGGSLHLARARGDFPALEGPEPAPGKPLELAGVFPSVPALPRR